MIRYEIKTSHAGVILDAALVARIVTTKAMRTPCVIVQVETQNRKAFEKYIEGEKTITGYSCDPRSPGKNEKDWTRK